MFVVLSSWKQKPTVAQSIVSFPDHTNICLVITMTFFIVSVIRSASEKLWKLSYQAENCHFVFQFNIVSGPNRFHLHLLVYINCYRSHYSVPRSTNFVWKNTGEICFVLIDIRLTGRDWKTCDLLASLNSEY